MTAPVAQEAGELAQRYAAAIDEGDLDAAAGLFAEDAVLLLPEPPRELEPIHRHEGRQAIRQALSSVFDVRATIHELTGQVVDTDAARASGRVSCVAHHYLDDHDRPDRSETAIDLVWRVRYDDEYIHRGGRWLIAARALTVLAVELHPVRAVLPRGGIRLLP
ncbi:MAG: nuclear transport factor 2 family protein [Nocardioides sp.]|uniref:nuclear transport factor 2 family protein n=1 Tax=Nocardioides sp. TaxID=35761 RepID=UPI0039E32890